MASNKIKANYMTPLVQITFIVIPYLTSKISAAVVEGSMNVWSEEELR